MQKAFEPLILQIEKSSYNSTNYLPANSQSPPISPVAKPRKNVRPQTVNILAKKREQQRFNQSRASNKRATMKPGSPGLNNSMNSNGMSFLKISVNGLHVNSQEQQEQTLQAVGEKLQASKAPPNTIITLEDLALRQRFLNQQGFTRKTFHANLNQSFDGNLMLHFQKIDKDMANKLKAEKSFFDDSPKKKSDESWSPNNRTINENNPIWAGLGKLENRAKTADKQRRGDETVNIRMNETFDLSKETKTVDLSLTQDEKVFKKIDLNAKRGKDPTTPSAELTNTLQSSKMGSTHGVAFGRRAIKNLNKTVVEKVDKSTDKIRLDTQNDSIMNEKPSIKKKDKQKKFDMYQQVVPEEERERMSKFLGDEFVNEMLLNKYHVDLDKFQIRDAINDISKKAHQDRLLRQKFRDFLKNGIIPATSSTQIERRSKNSTNKPSLNVPQPKRKKSESFSPDVSEDPINVVDTSHDNTKGKEPRRSRDTNFEAPKNKSRTEIPIYPWLLEAKRKGSGPGLGPQGYVGGNKSARSDDDDDELQTSKDDSKDEKQRREMQRIRLVEIKKRLNNKFNKGPSSKEDIDETTPSNMLAIANRNVSEQEQTHAFIRAAKRGDYKTIKRLVQAKPTLVSACDLLKKSALHWAAQEGHLEICQILLEHGANANLNDMGDKTPLYYALKEKHKEVARLLLSSQTGAMAVKTTTFGTLGEGVELLECLNEAQPVLPLPPAIKENNRRNRQYSIRVTQPRRDSRMGSKLMGLGRLNESAL